MMRKGVLILFVSIGILLSPFPINTAYNEYKLFKLSQYIDNIFEKTKNYKYFKLVADGSRVYNSTNGEACEFEVVRTYRVYSSVEIREEFIAEIYKLGDEDAFSIRINQPELIMEHTRGFIVLKFADGPFDPWFDIRCW